LLVPPGPTLPELEPPAFPAAPVVPWLPVPLRWVFAFPLFAVPPDPLVAAELLVGPLSERALPPLDWAKAPAVGSARMHRVVIISFFIVISLVASAYSVFQPAFFEEGSSSLS
jgi:hypothetical protein